MYTKTDATVLRRRYLRASSAGLALLCSLASVDVIAQTTAGVPATSAPATSASPASDPASTKGGSGTRLEEVVVTATKQGAINVQKVAESIQVFSSQTLQQQQIEGFSDYSRMVPSLSSINQGPGQSQIVMRGVTTGRITHAQPQNKSTTGVYIDDIPVSSGAFNPDLGLFDVSRIEVLRGPQGTLYGAGAMSGAIRIITNAPKLGVTEGETEVTASDTAHGGINEAVRGLINLPISSIAAVRASGFYQADDGYIDNVYTGEKNYNKDQSYGGKVALRVAPGGSWDVNFSVIYQNLIERGRPAEFLQGDPSVTAHLAPGETANITGPYQVAKFVPDPYKDRFFIANGVINNDFGFAKLTSSTSFFSRNNINILDDTYRNRIQQGNVLLDGHTGIFVPFINQTRTREISNETRLASPLGGRFEWVAGVFLNHQSDLFTQSAPENGLDALLEFLEGIGVPVHPSAYYGAQPNDVFDGRQNIRQTQYAAFGEATFNATKAISVLVGLRAYHYKEDFDLRYAGIAQGFLATESRSTKDQGVTPKFQLNVKPADNILLYAQAAKGFRLGGVNEPLPAYSGLPGQLNCAADITALGLPESPTFGSDTLWNYEVGFKGQTPDHRATLNVSAYQIDWSNIQTSVLLHCGFITVFNAGAARNRGLEGEFRVVPIDHVVLSASASYTDARLVKPGALVDVAAGSRLPNVPEYIAAGGVDYDLPLANGATVYARANLQYQSSTYSDFRGLATAFEVPSSLSEDIYLGYRRPDWEVALFVKNLSNARVVTAVDTDRNTPVTYSVAPRERPASQCVCGTEPNFVLDSKRKPGCASGCTMPTTDRADRTMLTREQLAHLQAVVRGERGLEGEFFTADALFQLDMKGLFQHGWMCVGTRDDAGDPGSLYPVRIADQDIILVRDKAGVLRAFFNHCSHRGAVLAGAPRRNCATIVCPYHAWTYTLNGDLLRTPHVGGVDTHEADGIDQASLGLREIAIREWAGLVFANLSGRAEDFDRFIAPLVERLEGYDWSQLHAAEEAAASVNANWKVVVENFVESYHLPWVHRDMNRYNPMEDHYQILGGSTYLGQGLLGLKFEDDGGNSLPNFANLTPDKMTTGESHFLFPNLFFGVLLNFVYAIILFPVAPGLTRERAIVLVNGKEAATDPAFAGVREVLMDRIVSVNNEDMAITESVQRGRSSLAFSGGRFSPVHERTSQQFQQAYALRLLAAGGHPTPDVELGWGEVHLAREPSTAEV